MFNSITELFLSEYFLIHTVLGNFLDRGKELFFSLGRICFIPDELLGKLYEKTANKEVAEINSEQSYKQHQRIKKYSEMNKIVIDYDLDTEEIINVKGNAIATAVKFQLKTDSDGTKNIVYRNLSTAANSGVIPAVRILGLLQAEGIFMDKNIKAGLKNLNKSADWNDRLSVLALLKYSESDREYNLSRLL